MQGEEGRDNENQFSLKSTCDRWAEGVRALYAVCQKGGCNLQVLRFPRKVATLGAVKYSVPVVLAVGRGGRTSVVLH